RARLRFAVRDTGVGISPEVQARLFQPFVQAEAGTASKFGGTGLGLAICRQLVTMMRGEIGIESAPGKGSTFWFTVELPQQPASPKTVRHHVDLAGKRGLIVDDNVTNREILARQLATWRIRAEAVASGAAALHALRTAAAARTPFDFCLLDMQMNGMNGVELAAQVRAYPALAGTRSILLSSIGHSLSKSELDAAGIATCLV